VDDDIHTAFLFNDPLVIVAGSKSKWVRRRRKIDLAELLGEPIMQGHHTWNYRSLMELCRSRKLPMPKASVVTLSISVITHFLANGPFITSTPRSVAYYKSLKVLPVDLPAHPWPVNVARLKNRTLRPIVERSSIIFEFSPNPCVRPARLEAIIHRIDGGLWPTAVRRLHYDMSAAGESCRASG